MEHTPTPWKLHTMRISSAATHVLIADTINIHAAVDECEANAAFIVRACNAHDDLVAALERVTEALEKRFELDSDAEGRRHCSLSIQEARAALAKAEGKA